MSVLLDVFGDDVKDSVCSERCVDNSFQMHVIAQRNIAKFIFCHEEMECRSGFTLLFVLPPCF